MNDKLLTYTVYSNNLEIPSRSFASDICVKDFNRNIDWKNFGDAKIIKYINPRGLTIILKDRNGQK